jgi:hypothetical protein
MTKRYAYTMYFTRRLFDWNNVTIQVHKQFIDNTIQLAPIETILHQVVKNKIVAEWDKNVTLTCTVETYLR